MSMSEAATQINLFEDAEIIDRRFFTGVCPSKAKRYDYEGFVDKFKPRLTTDDCFTPELVYDAIADWVAAEYELDRNNFVRPFWPGKDFTSFDYQPEHVVVDNPPFSICAKIVRYYYERDIRFFLFAPALTLFNAQSVNICAIACGVTITYQNGAKVPTSFITNLEEAGIKSCGSLYQAIKRADDLNVKQGKPELPKYVYPEHVVTPAMLNSLSKAGIDFKACTSEIKHVEQLDAMKGVKTKSGKSEVTIFGCGYLLSNAKARELAAAKQAAAKEAIVWELSKRELEIIKQLGA
nr:hypothetical protein [Synergistaceae bacterium]